MHRYCTGNERQEHARKRRNAAKGARAAGVDKLPGSRTVLWSQPHDPMEVRRQRRAQGGSRRPVPPHPPSYLAQLYGRESVRQIAMNDPAYIRYAQRQDATPKAELDALASAYRFVLDCRAKKEAA